MARGDELHVRALHGRPELDAATHDIAVVERSHDGIPTTIASQPQPGIKHYQPDRYPGCHHCVLDGDDLWHDDRDDPSTFASSGYRRHDVRCLALCDHGDAGGQLVRG